VSEDIGKEVMHGTSPKAEILNSKKYSLAFLKVLLVQGNQYLQQVLFHPINISSEKLIAKNVWKLSASTSAMNIRATHRLPWNTWRSWHTRFSLIKQIAEKSQEPSY
jgi:hypothetical protein